MNRMRRLILPLALILSACVSVTPSNTANRAAIADSTFPPMKTFGAPHPSRPINLSVWKVVATCLSLRALRNPLQCVLLVHHHKVLALI